MVTPSKETIDAALRLAACCNRFNEGPHDGGEYEKALSAYRATLPKLRTRAEVDADLALACRAAVESNQMCGALFKQYVGQLCAEPTRDDSGTGDHERRHERMTAAGINKTAEIFAKETMTAEELTTEIERLEALRAVVVRRGQHGAVSYSNEAWAVAMRAQSKRSTAVIDARLDALYGQLQTLVIESEAP